jgi:hypothetical protein
MIQIEDNTLEEVYESRSYCIISVTIASNYLPGGRAYCISFEFVQKGIIALIHRIESVYMELMLPFELVRG